MAPRLPARVLPPRSQLPRLQDGHDPAALGARILLQADDDHVSAASARPDKAGERWVRGPLRPDTEQAAVNPGLQRGPRAGITHKPRGSPDPAGPAVPQAVWGRMGQPSAALLR